MGRTHIVAKLFLVVVAGMAFSAYSRYSRTETGTYSTAMGYLIDRGEVYFSFALSDGDRLLPQLTKDISIDRVEQGTIYAYANSTEFEKFLQHKLPYEVLTPPGLLTKCEMFDFRNAMAGKGAVTMDWTKYPTYAAYVTQMQSYPTTYPNLCQITEIGQSIRGHKMLFARVTANVSQKSKKPKIICTGAIHGDETFGYMAMLRMIDYLCANYQKDSTVTKIVDYAEVWIMPLTNPDGTYKTSDNTVTGAVRYNNNGVDLNRSFPDPVTGWPTSLQQEVQNIVNFEKKYQFVIGVDLHGGMENAVYPYASQSKTPSDNAWWVYVAGNYARTVQALGAAVNYFKTTRTTGYGSACRDYYQAYGTRIDFPFWFRHDRNLTLEVNVTKLLPEGQLETYWNYNRQALLNFYLEALNGVHGTVTDSITNLPIYDVKILVNGDTDSSFTRSDSLGAYYRPIIAGTYTFTFSAPGYITKAVTGVVSTNGNVRILNVKLWNGSAIRSNANTFTKREVRIAPVTSGFRIDFGSGADRTVVSIFNVGGKLVRTLRSAADEQSLLWDGNDARGNRIHNGYYVVRASNGNDVVSQRLLINR